MAALLHNASHNAVGREKALTIQCMRLRCIVNKISPVAQQHTACQCPATRSPLLRPGTAKPWPICDTLVPLLMHCATHYLSLRVNTRPYSHTNSHFSLFVEARVSLVPWARLIIAAEQKTSAGKHPTATMARPCDPHVKPLSSRCCAMLAFRSPCKTLLEFEAAPFVVAAAAA